VGNEPREALRSRHGEVEEREVVGDVIELRSFGTVCLVGGYADGDSGGSVDHVVL
jgi:hypothetical protein